MSKKTKNYNPKIAIVSADAFFKHGESFLTEIGPELHTAAEKASQDLGGFVASATNLALAAELYLKTIWMLYGLNVPEHHRLWVLYKRLPNRNVKEAMKKSYDAINSPDNETVSALEIVISKSELDNNTLSQETDRLKIDQSDTSLAGVLKRANDSFITWRYLHEQESDLGVILLSYEFQRVKFAAKAIRIHAVRLLEEAHSKT